MSGEGRSETAQGNNALGCFVAFPPRCSSCVGGADGPAQFRAEELSDVIGPRLRVLRLVEQQGEKGLSLGLFYLFEPLPGLVHEFFDPHSVELGVLRAWLPPHVQVGVGRLDDQTNAKASPNLPFDLTVIIDDHALQDSLEIIAETPLAGIGALQKRMDFQHAFGKTAEQLAGHIGVADPGAQIAVDGVVIADQQLSAGFLCIVTGLFPGIEYEAPTRHAELVAE